MSQKHGTEDRHLTAGEEVFVTALTNIVSVTNLAKSLALQNPQQAEHLLQLTVLAVNQTSRRIMTGMGLVFGQRRSRREEVQRCSKPSS